LIVFAKSSIARDSLRHQFEHHTIVRAYLAITNGIPRKRSGKIHTYLARDDRGRRVVARKGKEAITHYQVIVCNDSAGRALLRCYLHTGRTHQVRIHLAHIGTPVLGDPVYGRPDDRFRLALHAEALGLRHPRSETPLVIRTSVPPEMENYLGSRSNRVYLQASALRQF
jgi:23S rRNA pseudouridine1911/1915/1917 synthase